MKDPFDKLFSDIEFIDNTELKNATMRSKVRANNRRTWNNPAVRERRSKGIKKAYSGKVKETKRLWNQIYDEAWSILLNSDRTKTSVIEEFSLKYDLHIAVIANIIYKNRHISQTKHKKNMTAWQNTANIWECEFQSPGPELLDDYDLAYNNADRYGIIPPSIVYNVRFNMSDVPAPELREYLLPWTKTIQVEVKSGRVRNGYYIKVRKNKFKFLTTQPSKKYSCNSFEDVQTVLKLMLGKTLNRQQAHHWIHNGTHIVLSTGWKVIINRI